MTPVGKACWLAVANVLVIAFALTVEIAPHDGALTLIITACAFWPALVLGYVLGKIAQSTAAQRPLQRLAVLALPACALVCVLAGMFDMLQFVPHACIPTLVASSLLERTTRQPVLLPRAVGR